MDENKSRADKTLAAWLNSFYPSNKDRQDATRRHLSELVATIIQKGNRRIVAKLIETNEPEPDAELKNNVFRFRTDRGQDLFAYIQEDGSLVLDRTKPGEQLPEVPAKTLTWNYDPSTKDWTGSDVQNEILLAVLQLEGYPREPGTRGRAW